jgi:hypothetical protein
MFGQKKLTGAERAKRDDGASGTFLTTYKCSQNNWEVELWDDSSMKPGRKLPRTMQLGESVLTVLVGHHIGDLSGILVLQLGSE